MRRVFTFIFAVMLVEQVLAFDFENGGLYYNIISTDPYEVAVSCPNFKQYGDCYANYTKPSGTVIIPPNVIYDNIEYKVTEINSGAFYECTEITSIVIPATIKTISYIAFGGCSGLTSIDIPSSVTYIGKQAFANCSGLTELTIPNSVSSVGTSAFGGCTGLISITIGNSVTEIDYWFNGCSGLERIDIPNTITSIGMGAFRDCINLKTVSIPNSVKHIGESAFYNCNSIDSVVIPNSVISIGREAFRNCHNLKSLQMGDSVERIGSYAFSDCENLIAISIPNKVSMLSDFVFNNCRELTDVSIGYSVELIGKCAFYNCSKLESIVIPASVVKIGDSAFNGCEKLSSVIIPNSVTSIGRNVFENCKSLTTIAIPNSITKIDSYTFRYCDSLALVSIPNTVTNIAIGAFSDCKNAIICCEATSQPEGWNSYWNIGVDSVCWGAKFINVDAKSNNETYGQVICSGSYLSGTNCIVQSIPKDHYHFVCWSDGNTENPRSLVANSDLSLTATFEGDSCIITAIEENCHIIGTGTKQYGDIITLEAIANIGFHFVMWSDGVATNPRTFIVESDSSVSAVIVEHNVVIDAAVAATCTVTGLTEGTHCSVCNEVLVAQTEIPALGHEFVNYVYNNDATTEADGTETATCDHGCGATDTRVAEGTKLATTAVEESAALAINIYAYGRTIVVENATDEIRVYNAMGGLVVTSNEINAKIGVSGSGVYIVKVGSAVKRVVVN